MKKQLRCPYCGALVWANPTFDDEHTDRINVGVEMFCVNGGCGAEWDNLGNCTTEGKP